MSCCIERELILLLFLLFAAPVESVHVTRLKSGVEATTVVVTQKRPFGRMKHSEVLYIYISTIIIKILFPSMIALPGIDRDGQCSNSLMAFSVSLKVKVNDKGFLLCQIVMVCERLFRTDYSCTKD